MTLIIETSNDANAKMLAAMLKRLDFVKAVNWKPTKNNKQKSLTDKDWILSGRPATDEEIEQMLAECEQGIDIPADESLHNNLKKFKTWKNRVVK